MGAFVKLIEKRAWQSRSMARRPSLVQSGTREPHPTHELNANCRSQRTVIGTARRRLAADTKEPWCTSRDAPSQIIAAPVPRDSEPPHLPLALSSVG